MRARYWAAGVGAVAFAAAVLALVSRTPRTPRTPAERPTRTARPAPLLADEDVPDSAGPSDGDPTSLVEDGRRYDVRSWVFALDRYDVRLEDVAMTNALDRALDRTGAELAVNAGFLDPAGKPLGLAISGGSRLAPFRSALVGGVVASDGERARLFATESFELPEGTRFALQCRPRLVVGGAPNVRSDDGQRSERTALCLRDGGRTIEAVVVAGRDHEASGPSLFALGRWLARHGCEEALNLDGGPSTGFAAREGATVRAELPRRPIRHAVVFVRRPE